MELLEVSKVNQVFRTGFWMRKVHILHDVSLKVKSRSVFGFLGANGAGKTTLIHLLVGIRKPSSGIVKINGNEATSLRARMLTGYLPERPYFHTHLTGEGVLQYFGALSGMKKNAIRSRIPVVLSAVGMTAARNVELRKYSKGMLQRIGIAQAILHDPEFLVLDEPMSGLDPLGRKEIRELIVNLASEGRTVFFSSHVIPDVESICDQVGLINKGRIIASGSIGDLLAQGPVQTEVAFSGVSIEKLSKMKKFKSLREIPNGVRAILPGQDAVGAVLSELLDMKAQILWVTPIRPSLEDLFKGEG